MIKAINKIGFASKNLLTLLARNYGELVYTNEMKVQDSFDKVPTFRAYDLDGKIINKKIKYDTEELVKILKTMIFVDEMDDILLKVKGQGIT